MSSESEVRMTKKIIIDGIDVSKCEYHGKCSTYCCSVNPNCYFKQLARAKGEIAKITSIINRLTNKYLDILKENEKLKMQLMQKSEVDTFFSTPIEGWDNDPCKICQYKQDYQAKEQENEQLRKQNEMLAKNNAVQQWCDMYNKKDKECFDALLKLAKKEQECEELKEKCNKYQNEICPQYSEELKKAYTRANKAEQECEELKKDCPKRCKSDNYKQALNEIEKCIKDIICKEECGINREYPCSDCDCSINDIIKIINKAKEQ